MGWEVPSVLEAMVLVNERHPDLPELLLQWDTLVQINHSYLLSLVAVVSLQFLEAPLSSSSFIILRTLSTYQFFSLGCFGNKWVARLPFKLPQWVNLDTLPPCPWPSRQDAALQYITPIENKCAMVNVMVSCDASTVKTNGRRCSSHNRSEGHTQSMGADIPHSNYYNTLFIEGLFVGTYYESLQFIRQCFTEIPLWTQTKYWTYNTHFWLMGFINISQQVLYSSLEL